MTAAPGPVPLRTLAVLGVGVLLVHGLVVHQAALGLSREAPIVPRVFVTRAVPAPASAPEPAAMPAPEPAPRPRAAAQPRAKAPDQPAPAPPPAAADLAQAAPTPPPPPPEAPARAATAPEPAASAMQAVAAPAPPPVATVAPSPAPASPAARADKEPPRNLAIPGSVRLKFNAIGMRGTLEYRASGELAWLHDGARYQARMEIGALFIGNRVLSSNGEIGADGLAPTRFSDKWRSELAAHFDRERARVVFSANTPEAVLLPGAQDQLSVFMQLASLLAGEPARYPAGSNISIQTISPRLAEAWTFVVEAPERLQLPGGEQATIKLTRQPRRDYDQKVELWLAPALSYLPARIRYTQSNGDYIDQQWRGTASP